VSNRRRLSRFVVHPVSNRNVATLPASLQGGNNCFHMAGCSLSGPSSEVTPHVHGVGDAPALCGCKGLMTFSVQPSYISVLLAYRRPGESSVLLSFEQPRKILVLALVIHFLIRQSFKAAFEGSSRRFWRALRPANSPEGLPLFTLLGFGLGLCLRELNRGPRSFTCLLLPWWQLCIKCPPLPQPQHTGARLPTTTVGDLVGRSAVACWHRCLISANSS